MLRCLLQYLFLLTNIHYKPHATNIIIYVSRPLKDYHSIGEAEA